MQLDFMVSASLLRMLLGFEHTIASEENFSERECMAYLQQVYNTLLVDKNQQNPAAAQASSNIIRCGLAAIVVAFLQKILLRLGVGWTFTIMSALCLGSLILFAVDYTWGFEWRQRAPATSTQTTVAMRSNVMVQIPKES